MEVQYNFNEALLLENQLCFPLYVASRLTTKQYTPFLKALDLTYPQYLVLLTLWEKDQLTVTEIGEKLFLQTNTLTPLLKRLEEKGFINRLKSASDERAINIVLSNQGKALKAKAQLIPYKMREASAMKNLSDTEVATFRSLLKKICLPID